MTEDSLRLDKWLWFARFFKTRSLATAMCNAGRLRVGGNVINKAHHKIRPGDVLTFPQGRHIRVVKVLALAARRGPAREAQALYEDLNPPTAEGRLPSGAAARPAGTGRPTKRDRREIDKLRDRTQ